MNPIKNTIFKQRGLVKFFFRRNKKNNENKDNAEDDDEYEEKKKEQNNDKNKNKNKDKKEGFFSFLKISQGQPMTKEEALRILNFTEKDELTSQVINERYEKYFLINNPGKGGSFYLQNKIFYAKEYLMQNFPKEENNSKYNLDNNIIIDKQEENKDNDAKI